MPLAVRATAGLADNLIDGALVKMRDLAVIFNLLRNEPDILLAVLGRVIHAFGHIDFIPVATDTGTQRRVHPLYRIEVSCRDHHEPAGNGFGSYHSAAGPFALAGNGELPFLERGQQV